MFEFKLPDLGEGIHEGELLKWYVKEGDSINEDDPLCEMETDKATVMIPSPRTGTVLKLNGKPGDTILVNQVMAVIEENPSIKLEKIIDSKVLDNKTTRRVAAAPATRRLAREMKIDITTVTGTGSAGKVTPDDIRLAGEKTGSPNNKINNKIESKDVALSDPDTQDPIKIDANAGIPFLEISALPDYVSTGPVEKIPMRSLRKKVAIKTTTSTILVPHVAHMDECDVTELETLRKTLNLKNKEAQKITLLSFVVKAIASLLKQYPEFNASVDPHKMEIIHKKYYHIGFAADTPKGLIVPVIEHGDQKNVSEIAREIASLAGKGQDGTITAKELSGSTFTITNVGAIGGTGVIPIINYPECAILGMGRVVPKPIVKDDEIVIRTILPVTLCFDHRVADGVRAAYLIKDLKQMLENPMIFLTKV
ncbi:MAG: 2-oxo acid dehydrogenase subunit E2 [Desulfobacula sp.]|jgi:pyruvate dehydrogenase E2 component (dihydrolipoamide acetyltransferase)|uniref:dihydrolipoamide acetyltransferase family protein n=1 Tax=Desulfobacula sp. TaxID=2593537 RepID=UPI001DEAF73A|nr:2-oxo acid dehydrogenase subunit E2 [Desulfobacula sp.]MBT3807210.1 2-oxo acid dehydrogenase subunit E2 [Desulfobacula sp.]MBT4027135.1 2-oxo acid dehydrogenase subunit E2 [Desulfobacula sp.]MBT4201089.1 2-oxo acid dehydrogenase subunit E2 [Desulfobacula sp.]MBT4508764.1 2-oxo acid dehydrogenase subunit E2 [Desulfobacula sp.]